MASAAALSSEPRATAADKPTAAALVLRAPSKYASTPSATFSPPPAPWLLRTWTVTHSTLRMWRTAQNVRVRYTARADGQPGTEDHVAYESNKKKKKKKVKSVDGVNAAGQAGGTFDWRGKGWLWFVGSHWEILGWGEVSLPRSDDKDGDDILDKDESPSECWIVTWFAPTIFSAEGIDLYSSRREGLHPDTLAAIQKAIEAAAWPAPLAALVRRLRPVDIRLPWQEEA